MEELTWVSNSQQSKSGNVKITKTITMVDPSNLIVTVLSSNVKSSGVLYPSSDRKMYVIFTYHSIQGEVHPRLLVYNLNGQAGKHVIISCRVIGFDKVSDIAVGLVEDSSLFEKEYYKRLVKWESHTDFEEGERTVVIGDSNVYGPHMKSFGVMKNNKFYGTNSLLLVRSCLVENIPSSSGGSGSGVFVCRRGATHFAGIVTSQLDNENNTVTVCVHPELVLVIIAQIIETGKLLGSVDDIYNSSTVIKRGYKKSFLGLLYQYINIDTLLGVPSLKTLSQSSRYTYGGILVTDFVHGYDTQKRDFITDKTYPFTQNDIRLITILQSSRIYDIFYAYRLPIILTDISYQKYNPDKKTYRPFVDKLGQFDYQVGLTEFDYFADYASPITLRYVYLDGVDWVHTQETLYPSTVQYTDEDGGIVLQSNLELPYPLYGLEDVGSVKYLKAESSFTSVSSLLKASTSARLSKNVTTKVPTTKIPTTNAVTLVKVNKVTSSRLPTSALKR